MADITASSFDQQEQAGRKRFKTGIEFEKIVSNLSRTIQDRMLNSLPSNYPKDPNTNLAELYRAIAEEFARMQTSLDDINQAQYHDQTPATYLFEILGDTLFLDNKAINYNICDEDYRNFLITVRNAYYGGSRKDNIQQAVSDILGIPVTIKEVYLELRKKDSAYKITDTHKMFFDIFMDYLTTTSSLGLILENLKYFLDLIKPDHVLYDTRLIWTEKLINLEGHCTPEYVQNDMTDIIYGVDKIDMITYVIDSLYLYSGTDPHERWVSGVIASTDTVRSLIYTTDNRILVNAPKSKLYRRTVDVHGEITDEAISFAILAPGDDIKYYATVDSSETSTVITSDWLYSGEIAVVDESSQTITLTNGKTIVYNEDVLVYTRDREGEYRIFVSSLLVGYIINFKGTEYSKSFDFYRVPEEVQADSNKQFDPKVIAKPTFQDYVKKVPETWDNLPLGPQVVVEDGIATVIDIKSKFYKRSDSVNYKNFKEYRYNLFIDDIFEKQFTVEEPAPEISIDAAKAIFRDVYGYTGIGYPYTGTTTLNYNITTSSTAHLKETDEDPTVQAIGDQTEACDRRADCHLLPYYEDTRKYYEYPDVQLTSGFISTVELEAQANLPDQHNLPGYFRISSDPNNYQMPLLPILNSSGVPAVPADLTVFVNGLKVDNAVTSVDPWSGEIELNFLPPANSIIRIDYFYSGRYPVIKSYIEKIGVSQSSHRLQWPYPVTGLYGGQDDYQVDLYPILNQKGDLASPTDVTMLSGDIGATGIIESIIDLGDTDILVSDVGLPGVSANDTIIIKNEDYYDPTIIYTIAGITGAASDEIIVNKKLPYAIEGSDVTFEIVRFTGAIGVIDRLRPLLGHIHVTGAPAPVTGSYTKFDYYYTDANRTYAMVPDTMGETGPYMDQGYAADTFYGNYNGFTLVPDRGLTGFEHPIFDYNQVAKKGYRYRAFNLSNSSVLNSRDTLVLDGYYREQGNASWKNNRNKLGQYDILFSPEYLKDTSKNIVLNDKYLLKDLDPVTKMYPGTPPFVQSFSDDCHFKDNIVPIGENTHQDPSDASQDLQAGFTIVGTDASGLADYQSVCEFSQNHRIRLYSGLKMVEKDFEGFQGPLSSITEGQRSLPFKTLFVEQYYPNREQRLNDYLDYINRIPEEIKTGTIKVLKNSVVVKKVTGNWLQLKIGDMFNVKDIPIQQYDKISSSWKTIYNDVVYTVLKIIDYETAELSSTFKYTSGEYDYDLIRDSVYKVDVYLNEVNRKLVFNGLVNYNYSLPAAFLTHLPGYGVTGYNMYFQDPDSDPYPRSPKNPNISGLPTGDRALLVTHETGLGPTDSDKIPLTREIIGADGNSVPYYYTGGLTGFTGPSGAVDLGLTGPTDVNNPRILEDDDKYLIPSGATGTFWAISEAEYRVNWRNWDQEVIMINYGPLTGPDAGVILEDPINMMNDLGEGIKRAYWNLTTQQLEARYYFGTVFETSELIDSGIGTDMVNLYAPGMILLNQDQILNMVQPDIADTLWNVKKKIIREILYDGSLRVTEINEFESKY